MPQSPPQSKYGELPSMQVLGLIGKIIPLPVILLWTALVTAHATHNKGKSLKRIIAERAMRYGIANLTLPQLQYLFGTPTSGVYHKWTKQTKLTPATVDDLGENAKLLWIGPKRTDRVLLFLHGGCYVLPVTDFLLDFLRYLQLELEKQDIEIGIAVLEYSLAPYATFPTPLKQASLAVQFLLAAGLDPKNLFIGGDSAGGNLAVQVVSQMLHPIDGLPDIRPSKPIGGLCLLSPWSSFTVDAKSYAEFEGIDTLPRQALATVGRELLAAYPKDHAVFAEPAKAPASWFAGIDVVVSRVLVTAGGRECMRDDIVQLGDLLKKQHANAEVVIQSGGLHDDMLLDFMAKEKKTWRADAVDC
ncbi:Alpha/Beta hydrolase protein [Mycena amicta]|nr:Alpha/Beta hydrolase protein [Mycena amicta]